MPTAFILSQILVGLACITDFLSFQFKEQKHIVLMLALSCVLIASHYFLLGKITAGVLIIISIIQYVSAYFTQHKFMMFIILVLQISTFIFTYNSPLSFIILIGLIFSCIAAFQKNDKILRIFLMNGGILILIYNIIIFSPIAALLESWFLFSNLAGYYKFYLRKK